MDALSELTRHGVVPVVVIDDAAGADPMADALVAGGLPVAEVTLRTAAANDTIAAIAARGDVLVGAGTVTTPAQVDQVVAAGARFVVSPGLSRGVVARAREYGVAVLPGVVTPTEVLAALELGLTTVKFVPAVGSGGAPAVAALAAPFARMSFVPTGGIKPEHLAAYLRLPSVAAVAGSWLVPRSALAAGRFDVVREATEATVALVRANRPTV